jgi:hypothetical protein
MPSHPSRASLVFAAPFLAAALALWGLTCVPDALAQVPPSANKGTKAKPKFGPEIKEIFFPDARQKLGKGNPPGGAIGPATTPGKGTPKVPTPTPDPTPETPVVAAAGGWGEWLAAEVLEGEIKAQATAFTNDTKQAGPFKANLYKKVQVETTILTVMFGVIAQFEGQVRWKDKAAGLRDELAKVSAQCKTGDQYQAVKLQADSLGELVRGSQIDVAAGKPSAKWQEIAEFSALMKRMEVSEKEKLKPLLGSEADFKANKELIQHEATILAILAEVITDKAYDSAGEDDYQKWAKGMKASAIDIVDACRQDQFEKARTSCAALFKSCDACHGAYK